LLSKPKRYVPDVPGYVLWILTRGAGVRYGSSVFLTRPVCSGATIALVAEQGGRVLRFECIALHQLCDGGSPKTGAAHYERVVELRT
jgi:hypothetical protein